MRTASEHLSSAFLPESRFAGKVQGWVLVATAWLSVAAAVVIAPILPKMSGHFAHGPYDPNIGKLIALVATLPALLTALVAAPSGALADFFGSRRVLLSGLVLYGLCGVAPLWLETLPAIIASRVGVGIGEGIIITCGTAMLGDYFAGPARETWLALQAGSANLVAVFLVLIGGVLGERTWRLPFSVYSLAFLLFPLVLWLTWESKAAAKLAVSPTMPLAGKSHVFKALWPICLLTIFASAAFFVMVIQQGFLLTDRGFSSPKLIGISGAAISVAVPLGSVLFRVLSISRQAKLTLSFALSALGFTIIALTHGYAWFLVGGAINGLGSGIVLPTLITWALSELTPKVRGFGTGLWQAALFLGQFLSPFTVLLLGFRLGGRQGAVAVYALACGIAAVASAGLLLRSNRFPALKQGIVGRP